MTPRRQQVGNLCLGGSVLCSLGTWYSAATVASQPGIALGWMMVVSLLYLACGMGAVANFGYQRGKRPYLILAASRLVFAGGVLMTILQMASKP